MQNPYQAPAAVEDLRPARPRRYYGGVYFALGWTALLYVLAPVTPVSSTSLLPLKLATTFISLGAAYNLLFIPPGTWKLMTWPIAALLVLVQVMAWIAWP